MALTDSRAQGAPPCANCGRRPGTVEVVYNTGSGRVHGALCEACARRLVAQQGRGLGSGFGAFGPGAEEAAESATPALDGFGRDLTAEAADGRIDPVIGRESEIEQTVEILA